MAFQTYICYDRCNEFRKKKLQWKNTEETRIEELQTKIAEQENELTRNETIKSESVLVEQSTEQTEKDSIQEIIQQIFDKVFKKVITLSSRAVINLINGLFDTDYPTDCEITYNWTEFEDENLKRILADTILTINGKYSYHLEAQIEEDENIVFRVFEYGNGHALRTRFSEGGKYILRFPKPMVIYLYYKSNVPDEYTLTLEFDEGQGVYEYKVPVLKLPEISAQELTDRKMVVLIPFHILKLRYAIKDRKQDLEQLQSYILNDILGCITKNLELGNITMEDALKLKRYLCKLCDYLSVVHKELKGMKDMTDESFMTDIDIICEEHERAMAEKDKKLAEQNNQLAEKDSQLAEKDNQLAEQSNQLRESAKALKRVNLSNEEIHKITGLSIEVIASLR